MYLRKLCKKDTLTLQKLYKKLEHNTKYYVGYPPNTIFDYSELYPFLKFAINNLGDPFKSIDPMSSHNIEREVLTFFSKLTKAPSNFSGYVTNGSTEGNLYGLYLAKKSYPHGIAYFSAHTHYSVLKALDILNIPYKVIPTLDNGEINYKILANTMKRNINKPAIIVANIGTTVVSAIDNINLIKNCLMDIRLSNYFIHADAAFDGMILPFVDNPPPYTFSDGVDSITISCNKFIGAPIPCGIVITKQSYVDLIDRRASCVRRYDSTISGSRNGITPIFIWYAIKRMGEKGFKKIVRDGFRKANYGINLFNKNNIKAWKNKYSLTVVIPELSSELLKKWHAPTEHGWSSITTLPKLSYDMIDNLCNDILKDKIGKFTIKKEDKLILY